MKKFTKLFALILLVTLFTGNARVASANNAQKQISFEESGWMRRCQKDPKTGKEDTSRCEITKNIKVKDAKASIAEIAIGRNTKNQDIYSGIAVMPLGILLEEGVQLKIDDGKPVMFKPRFCVQMGCVSYINLDKNLISSMKKGNKLTLTYISVNNKKVKIDMSLAGFTKAVKSI